MNTRVILLGLVLLGLTACSNFGERLDYDPHELYFKDCSIEVAGEVGLRLKRWEYFHGAAKSVQLVRRDTGFDLNFAVLASRRGDYNTQAWLMGLAANVSREALRDEPVTVGICDERLTQLLRFPVQQVSHVAQTGAVPRRMVYTERVERERAQDLLRVWSEEQPEWPETWQTPVLDKIGDVYVLRLPIHMYREKALKADAEKARKATTYFSQRALRRQPLEIHLTDSSYRPAEIIFYEP